MPVIDLQVSGETHSFLMDTGATCSSLSGNSYEGPVTEKTIRSVGVSGTNVLCQLTPPLEVVTPNDICLHHKFVIVPNSPLNLLGRDLMHKLGIEIVFSDVAVNFSLFSDLPQITVDLIPHSQVDNSNDVKILNNIDTVNPQFWTKYKDETGLVNMLPYKAKLKTKTPVYIKQYPLSPEKVQGIKPIIDIFLKQGVLKPIHSPYNTPINPIKKADGKSWRLTQDLRAINALIIPLAQLCRMC
ncbi:MAG: hypothetical protein ACRDDA_12460 [Aeromonas sp.]